MGGVYISYPYCRQKCTYCNFSSGVGIASAQADYIAAITREIADAQLPWSPRTIYLGGGTPSLIPPEEFKNLLASIPGRPWSEATIEVAPGDIDLENAQAWSESGISRVSLGVQSFNREVARASGRMHDAETVRRELQILHDVGIHRASVDLIAGLARQTAETWEADLDWVERLGVEHASVYMLEVDDESRLGGELRSGGARYGARLTPDDEQVAAMYERAVERLSAIGLERYEISNFARPGAESQHNLAYWTMTPYWGFGADAHSFHGSQRWFNVKTAGEYLSRAQHGESTRVETEQLDERRLLEDRLLTGLRTRNGALLSRREAESLAPNLADLTARGWLEAPEPGRLRLTNSGILFANEALRELLFADDKEPRP